MSFDLQTDKIALRVVQKATLNLDGVRVLEDHRSARARSWADTTQVLRLTRMEVV